VVAAVTRQISVAKAEIASYNSFFATQENENVYLRARPDRHRINRQFGGIVPLLPNGLL